VTSADQHGRPMAKFPGEHGGFLALPEQFSQDLDQVLTGLPRRQICLMPHPCCITHCDQLGS
jgi:hypothetical protein